MIVYSEIEGENSKFTGKILEFYETMLYSSLMWRIMGKLGPDSIESVSRS